MKVAIAIGTIVALVAFTRVEAGNQTIEYSFTQNDITTETGSPNPPPVTSISGNFTVTFDTATSGAGTIDAVNLNIDGFMYSPSQVGASFNATTDTLLVGGPNAGLGFVQEGTNDFTINISPAVNGTTAYGLFAYSTAQTSGIFEGYGYSFTGGSITSKIIAPVPLPASWLFMIPVVGFLAARAGGSRKRLPSAPQSDLLH